MCRNKQWKMVQGHGPLPPTRETWTKLLASTRPSLRQHELTECVIFVPKCLSSKQTNVGKKECAAQLCLTPDQREDLRSRRQTHADSVKPHPQPGSVLSRGGPAPGSDSPRSPMGCDSPWLRLTSPPLPPALPQSSHGPQSCCGSQQAEAASSSI